MRHSRAARYSKGRTTPKAAARVKDEVNEKRRARREDNIAKARRQQLAQDDLERAAALDKNAVSIAVNVRRAFALGPGHNLQQLEYIRLTLGFKTELTTRAYEALVTSALKAGLIELLGTNLSLSLSPQSAVGALKASHIACNLAADSQPAAAALLRLSPVLIAHVGLSYGSELCTQCAWTLSNLATLSPVAARTLVAQGAIPTLLEVLEDAGRTPEDPSRAYAGATCAWALSNIVRCTGDCKAANTLLSVSEPPVDTIFSRVLTNGFVDADLCAETAWLLVHTLENVAASATALACRGGIVPALSWCLEAAVADSSEDEQVKLVAMRERWGREGIHAWEQCVGTPGAVCDPRNACNASPDQLMREPVLGDGMHDSDDDSDMEASNVEGSEAGGRLQDSNWRLWAPTQQHEQVHEAVGRLQNQEDSAACIRTVATGTLAVQQAQQGGVPEGSVAEGSVAPTEQGGLQLRAGEPKWGLALDTSQVGTSDVPEHSLLAISQLSSRTLATSEGRGGMDGRPGGSDAAGRNVAEGHSCMVSETEQEAATESPIRCQMTDPLIRCLGALMPHMSPKQLLAALPAHSAAAARALLVVATSETCPARCAACWALANMAATPAGAAMLEALHAGPILTQLLRETKSKLLRRETATVLFNLCLTLTTPPAQRQASGPPRGPPPPPPAGVTPSAHNEREKDAQDPAAAAFTHSALLASAAGVATGAAAVQEHLASASLHCTLVEMLQEEGASSVARGVYDAVALQMLTLMARCFPETFKAFSTLGGKAALAAFQRNRSAKDLEPVAPLVTELAHLLYC